MLLILGLLDVNEYWGSSWGRCMVGDSWENVTEPSKKISFQGGMGVGEVLLEGVSVRNTDRDAHPTVCLWCSLISIDPRTLLYAPCAC